VGGSSFTFSPDTLTISPGSKVEFHFQPGDHSVTQASFANPCHPISDTGIFSGFVPGSSGGGSVSPSMEDIE
jgi:plastocyanin